MEDLILEKIAEILKLSKEINEQDKNIGVVLIFCLKQFMDLIEAKESNGTFNVNEFIDFASKLTGVDYRSQNPKPELKIDDKADPSIIDYILGNSDNIEKTKIEEYEDFINKSIKKIQQTI